MIFQLIWFPLEMKGMNAGFILDQFQRLKIELLFNKIQAAITILAPE